MENGKNGQRVKFEMYSTYQNFGLQHFEII